MAVNSFQGNGAAEILYGKETIIKIPIFYGQAKTVWFFLDSTCLMISVWCYFNHREEICSVGRDLQQRTRQMLHSVKKKYREDSAVVIE